MTSLREPKPGDLIVMINKLGLVYLHDTGEKTPAGVMVANRNYLCLEEPKPLFRTFIPADKGADALFVKVLDTVEQECYYALLHSVNLCCVIHEIEESQTSGT